MFFTLAMMAILDQFKFKPFILLNMLQLFANQCYPNLNVGNIPFHTIVNLIGI